MDKLVLKAIEWCIGMRVPFAAYKLPNQKKIAFWAAPSLLLNGKVDEKRGFFVGEFNKPSSQFLWIPFELNAQQLWQSRMSLPRNPYTDIDIPMHSTSESEYMQKVGQLISELRQRGDAKTVISVVKDDFLPNVNSSFLIENLFDNSEGEFCNAYYHPEVGFWMGATPELLLKIDNSVGEFHTMALAGTIPADMPWDSKNQTEHNYVVDYISGVLSKHGLEYTAAEQRDVSYGCLRHLCTSFTGTMPSENVWGVIDELNPTPALCGYPKDMALADIAAIESHQRKCYGGVIGVSDNSGVQAYVNIRCSHFCKSNYRFYGGGGIVADSNAQTEWHEANSKLLQFVAKILPKEQ